MNRDVVTVPNLSEHLSSAETTEQLSARFASAAAMKSMNNLLLLGDGETWTRQKVDFAGLPEMARTFLQVAAGAADIPVTRLLGQSPSGLSATGESDVRNYYDMIAARQELDLRPQLERLDRLICWSEDIDEGALTFAFRPLWQLDEPARAALAPSRAQATQVYAGLKLWPDAVMAKLAEAQLVADGTYPNAAAVFAESGTEEIAERATTDAFPADPGAPHYLTEPRDPAGRWTTGGGPSPARPIIPVSQINEDPDPTPEEEEEELEERLRHQNDPLKQFRFGIDPNGIVHIPVMPGGSGAPSMKAPPAVAPVEGDAPSPAPILPSSPATKPDLRGIVGPGPYARESVPAGPSPRSSQEQKEQVDAIGRMWGCHRCGTKDPDSRFGRFLCDHQLPTALNPNGCPKFYIRTARDAAMNRVDLCLIYRRRDTSREDTTICRWPIDWH